MIVHIETTSNHRPEAGPTLGDYWIDEIGVLQIRVSDDLTEKEQKTIIIHELCEAFLCSDRNISFHAIDSFDSTMLTLDEPGNDPLAPYHKEHVVSTYIEQIMRHELGIDQ